MTADESHTLRVRLTVTESKGKRGIGDFRSDRRRHAGAVPTARASRSDTCTPRRRPPVPGQGHVQLRGRQTGAGHDARRRARRSTSSTRSPWSASPAASRATRQRSRKRHGHGRPRGTRIRRPLQGAGLPVQAQGRRRAAHRHAFAASAPTVRRRQIEIRVTQPEKIGKYTRDPHAPRQGAAAARPMPHAWQGQAGQVSAELSSAADMRGRTRPPHRSRGTAAGRV